jgi:hypothetical protein
LFTIRSQCFKPSFSALSTFFAEALAVSLIGGRSSRARKRFWLEAALAGGMAAAVLCTGIGRAQDVPPDPRLLERLGVLFVERGLDARNNRLDRLVATYGPSCLPDTPLQTRPCAIDRELLSFLRALAPDQDSIARELEALGATCRKHEGRLDCLYERHVRTTAWAQGHDGPVAVTNELYRIIFTVKTKGDQLDYSVEFHRT